MSAEPGPPPIQPPQLSPDGKYVWDGSKWQPIADPAEPTHRGVFAAWNAIQVDPADPVAEAPKPVPVQVEARVQVQTPVQIQEPAPEIDYSYTVDDPTITPLWAQPAKSGMTNYLYAGAGIVILVMAVMLLNSFNFYQYLPWYGAGSSSASVTSPQPTPVVDNTRSDFGRADRFLNGALVPAVATMADAMQQMQTCNGTLSNSCYDAIVATEPQLKKVLAVVDRGPIPLCIAAPMKSFRADVVNMEAGLQLSLKGYKNNNRGDVGNGLTVFARSSQAMAADGKTADQLHNTQCSKDLEGP